MMGWRLLCSGLVFVAVSTAVAAGIGSLAGSVREMHAWISLGTGALAALATWSHSSAPRQQVTLADTVLFVIFGLAALRAFLWVIHVQGDDIKVLSPNNLGDLSLHLNLIRRWAAGGAFWPENPFLTGAIFPYHAGMDLWNALLAILGVPVMEGLRWAGLLGSAAAAVALWRWGRGFALAAFLFAGGFAAVALLRGESLAMMEENLAWKNLFLAMFVTQRGLLHSLPAGLVLLCTWRAQLRGDNDGPKLAIPAQVALYATMPLFNAPAFLFLSALLAACFIVAWRQGRARAFFAVGAASVMPAAWFVALVTANFTAPSALRFDPGWMQGGEGWWFWLRNFGVFLPLAAATGVIILRRGTDAASRVFYIVGAGTLAFCLLFIMAPWAWDNTKLMIWGYLALVPLMWTHVIGPCRPMLRAMACVLLFGSGAVSLVAGLDARHGYVLASRAELDEMRVLLRSVPPNTRIACLPTYNHPVLLLGRPVVMGYDGHLYSQGIDYRPVQRDLNALMSGASTWRNAARHLQAHYLLWGPREERQWPSSRQPWLQCAQLVARTDKAGALYRITPCLLED